MLNLPISRTGQLDRPAVRIARRIWHRILFIGPTALLAIVALALPAHADGPVLTLETQAAVASGITPGGSVALFTAARGFNGFLPYLIHRREVVSDDDRDGAVRLEASFPIPLQSVWAAVDLATGGFTLAAPEGFELREVSFLGNAFGAVRRSLADRRRFLEILVVRPSASADTNAWKKSFSDSSPSDDNGVEDLGVRAQLSSLEPLAPSGGPAPNHLAGGDVLIVVDPYTLEFYAAQLAK